jgi:hypothetical protein
LKQDVVHSCCIQLLVASLEVMVTTIHKLQLVLPDTSRKGLTAKTPGASMNYSKSSKEIKDVRGHQGGASAII